MEGQGDLDAEPIGGRHQDLNGAVDVFERVDRQKEEFAGLASVGHDGSREAELHDVDRRLGAARRDGLWGGVAEGRQALSVVVYDEQFKGQVLVFCARQHQGRSASCQRGDCIGIGQKCTAIKGRQEFKRSGVRNGAEFYKVGAGVFEALVIGDVHFKVKGPGEFRVIPFRQVCRCCAIAGNGQDPIF